MKLRLIMAALVAVGLAACGADNDNAPESKAPDGAMSAAPAQPAQPAEAPAAPQPAQVDEPAQTGAQPTQADAQPAAAPTAEEEKKDGEPAQTADEPKSDDEKKSD